MQVDVVLEFRVLHLAGKMKLTETLGGILSLGNLKACPSSPTMTDFLQEDHTPSNKTIPPNSASPYEIIGAN